jgi:hypothetical protein
MTNGRHWRSVTLMSACAFMADRLACIRRWRALRKVGRADQASDKAEADSVNG